MQTTTSERRFRKRLPCRLALPTGAHSGMVLNVSRGGLFVQTSAAASPGDAVRVDLSVGEPDAVAVDARVVWRRMVAPHLRSVSTVGMGVHIQYASDAWFGFLARLADGMPAEASTPAAHAPSGPAFRVRLRLAGGSRTRILTVVAADEGEARARACQQAGPQWSVLDLEKTRED